MNGFKLGDVVRIKNINETYNTYNEAFDFFCITKNIIKYDPWDNSWKKKELIIPGDYKNHNWLIINKALHGSSHSEGVILYHIINSKGESLVVNERAIFLRPNIETKLSMKLKEKNKTFVLKKIIND
jgi:hypothetical protein